MKKPTDKRTFHKVIIKRPTHHKAKPAPKKVAHTPEAGSLFIDDHLEPEDKTHHDFLTVAETNSIEKKIAAQIQK